MNRYLFGIRVVCALSGVCVAAPVAAQGASAPFSGLFGRAARGQQSLDVRGDVFGTYDDNLLAQGSTTGDALSLDPRADTSGVARGFDSTVNYAYVRVGSGKSNSAFNLGGMAAIRQFSTGLSAGTLWSPNAAANVGFRTNFTPKISFGLRANAGVAPYYQYAAFLKNAGSPAGITLAADAGPPPDATSDTSGAAAGGVAPVVTPTPDVNPIGSDIGYAVSSQRVASLNASASIADRFTKRDSAALDVAVDQTQVFGTAKIDALNAHGTLTHNLTRKIGVRVGYNIQQVEYSSRSFETRRTENHFFDFGVDYGDGGSFQFWRRYTFTFNAGLSALRQADLTAFRLNGAMTLARSLGRTWAASIGAARGTEYVLGFVEPLLSDSVFAGLGGQIAHRVQLTTGGQYMRAQRAFFASDGAVVSKSASTRVTVAINQHLGLYGQYSYYLYSVPVGYFVDLEFPRNFNRQSATVGLSLWAPILNRQAARKP